MHAYDAHGPPYFISSSGVMQFREACYTVVSYAPYILLQIYTITILASFRVTIFEFFHPGPQSKCQFFVDTRLIIRNQFGAHWIKIRAYRTYL